MTKNLSLSAIDHFVLTVKDVERSVHFYSECLGCTVIRFGENRFAVQIGSSKINFHESDQVIEPHAAVPTSGSADFCLLTPLKVSEIESYLSSHILISNWDLLIEPGHSAPSRPFISGIQTTI